MAGSARPESPLQPHPGLVARQSDGIGAVNFQTERRHLMALPWLTRGDSESQATAHFKTRELAKRKASWTRLTLLSFCFSVLWDPTLLLSWPSVPEERESSAVSAGTLGPVGCVWGAGKRGYPVWAPGRGRYCHEIRAVVTC